MEIVMTRTLFYFMLFVDRTSAAPTRELSFVLFSLLNVLHSDPTSTTLKQHPVITSHDGKRMNDDFFGFSY